MAKTWQIVIAKRAERELRRLPRDLHGRVLAAITSLATDPRPPGSKKLAGRDAWRVRVSDYRVLYEIEDRELRVLVLRVAHRRDVYR